MADATPEKDATAAAVAQRAERLAKLEGARMAGIGSETMWLGVDADGSVGARAGDGKVKTSGSVEKADGVGPDALAFVVKDEGQVAFEPPLILGEKFALSLWFKTPVPDPPKTLGMITGGSQPRQTPQGMQMIVGGIGFTKDSLGVMIMGQFDPLDAKFSMLTDGWHLLTVNAPGPKDEGATFHINNVHCGDTSAPLLPTLSAIGNLAAGGGQFPKDLGAGMPLADVRVFGGHHLTDEERAKLLSMVPAGERGTGPDEAAMQQGKAEAIIEGISRFTGMLGKLAEDPLSEKPTAAFGIKTLKAGVEKLQALADSVPKADGALASALPALEEQEKKVMVLANDVSKTMKELSQIAQREKQEAEAKEAQRKQREAAAAAREPELCSFYQSSGASVPWGLGPEVAETYGIKYDCPLAFGKRLFAAGRVAAATDAYKQAVALNDKDSEAWRMLGCCYTESDDDIKAIQCLEKSVEIDPSNRAALVSLGVSLTNEQKTDEAVSTLRKWIMHNPRLSELHDEAKPADDAGADGGDASEGSPKVPDSDFSAAATFDGAREGWVFGTSGNGTGYYKDVPPVAAPPPPSPTEVAADLFTRTCTQPCLQTSICTRAFTAVPTAIRWHRSHTDAQIERRQEHGRSLFLAGTTLTYYLLRLTPTGAAKIVPDEPEPFIILGVLCVIAGKYEEAIDHMKSALENDPTDYTLWNKLGAVQTHSSQVRSPPQSSPLDSHSLSLCLLADPETEPFVLFCVIACGYSVSRPRLPTSAP
jgi:tetratricopeptide (TPR) repeat protein